MAQQHTVGKHATTIVNNEQVLIVTYHETVIVEYDRGDGTVVLDNGGYVSKHSRNGRLTYYQSTFNRLNQVSSQFGLGYHVYGKDGEMWALLPDGTEVMFDDSNRVVFKI